jgi:hypothetical protein
MPKTKNIDWTPYDNLLGTMPDTAVAKLVSCSPTAVFFRRRKLEIGRHPGRLVDWPKYDHLLGTIPDTHIAKMAGCSQPCVNIHRNKLGIAPYTKAEGDAVTN